jgi:NAD(P)-dependent dehydrogenase (short-subunit alcohol dehydrogenase family)
LFKTIDERWGKVDVLINNAGISHRGNLFTEPVEVWDRILNVNLRGAYLCAKYAASIMKEHGGGSIVNIASTRALMSEPDSEAYAASKGGILALTHALAVSLGPYGIRVNAVSPGWIEVGDWQKKGRTIIPYHSERDKAQHPVGRVGTPGDIAEACLYLTTEEAGFITGTNLVVDGGMTKKMIYEE